MQWLNKWYVAGIFVQIPNSICHVSFIVWLICEEKRLNDSNTSNRLHPVVRGGVCRVQSFILVHNGVEWGTDHRLKGSLYLLNLYADIRAIQMHVWHKDILYNHVHTSLIEKLSVCEAHTWFPFLTHLSGSVELWLPWALSRIMLIAVKCAACIKNILATHLNVFDSN